MTHEGVLAELRKAQREIEAGGLSEADTRRLLIGPVIEWLGYDNQRQRWEHGDAGNRPDYLLYANPSAGGTPAQAVVEAKPHGADFDHVTRDDRASSPDRQIRRYLSDHAESGPATIGALTDGLRWRIYRKAPGGDVAIECGGRGNRGARTPHRERLLPRDRRQLGGYALEGVERHLDQLDGLVGPHEVQYHPVHEFGVAPERLHDLLGAVAHRLDPALQDADPPVRVLPREIAVLPIQVVEVRFVRRVRRTHGLRAAGELDESAEALAGHGFGHCILLRGVPAAPS